MTTTQPTLQKDTQNSLRTRMAQWLATFIRQGDLGAWPVLIGLLAVAIYFRFQTDIFLTPRNLSNLVLQVAAIATISAGTVLVLLIAEVDLSSGPLSAFAAVGTALLSAQHGVNAPLAILIGLLVGAACGTLVGTVVTLVGVPSFVVTLGASLMYTGALIELLSTGGSVLVQDPVINGLTEQHVSALLGWVLVALIIVAYGILLFRTRSRRLAHHLPVTPWWSLLLKLALVAAAAAIVVAVLNADRGIPLVGVIVLALVLLLDYIAMRTRFGRAIYAVGGNAESARRAGIPVTAIRIAVFTLASTLAAFGGLILLSRDSSVSTASGGGDLTLNVIAAAVIGGISLFGGRGRVWAALLGALMIGSALNGMDLLSVSSGTKFAVIGAILVLSVTVDALSRKQRRATGRF